MARMPCDARRLLRVRLRPHGEATTARALHAWDDDDLVPTTPGPADAPLDARAFLGDWPLDALVPPADAPVLETPLLGPPPETTLVRSLAELFEIDDVGTTMTLTAVRDSFDLSYFRAALMEPDAEITDRYAVALFRLLALTTKAPLVIQEEAHRQCLLARYFHPGPKDEITALRAAQAALPEASLNMVTFRDAVRSGVIEVLGVLEREPLTAVVLDERTRRRFAEALKLEVSTADPSDVSFAEGVVGLLRRESEATPNTDGHLSRAALTARRDTALARERLLAHLLYCRDWRCLELVRAEVCGKEAVRRLLSGPLGSPSSPPPAVGTPRLIRCRDVLWDAFANMAKSEGRDVDDLVEEAMDRYRMLRQTLREQDPAKVSLEESTPPPSGPPPSGRAGLRLPNSRSDVPPPSVDEPTRPTIVLGDDETTRPR
jgi:hypothetical protein